ncbi:MAG: hypothetical protein ACI8UZ_003582 [Akkermansiaceae bacterium]|jgi:hypothetical protein
MPQTAKPIGHFPVPLIIFGFVSLLLGTATEVLGAFNGATESLRGLLESGGLVIQSEMGLPGMVGVFVTAAASFGLIAAILGTPGLGRQLMIGFSALLLTLTLIPAFAVWGIFWKPFGVLLAVVWSWFSATVYAQIHRMPCEGIIEDTAENIIRLEGDHMTEQHSKRSDGQG